MAEDHWSRAFGSQGGRVRRFPEILLHCITTIKIDPLRGDPRFEALVQKVVGAEHSNEHAGLMMIASRTIQRTKVDRVVRAFELVSQGVSVRHISHRKAEPR
jgi:hypothetical protein